ncbi:MAG: AbgT family transporter, partial [Flavobacterium sp.]
MEEKQTNPKGFLAKALDFVEKKGNKLPDPAILFGLLMVFVWFASWAMSGIAFTEIDPRTMETIQIKNLLAGASLAEFMSKMVTTFVNFAPLGVVLVAMLGLGVAEHTGFINAGLRAILNVTPKMLLTPVLIAVGILSHIAVDAGYVLVIPLGAVIFYAAGRHPLAGIAAAFAGVSGGFSATFFVPSSLDPMLAGITQEAARLSAHPAAVDMMINPLNNFYFTTASSFLVVIVGWILTDKFIEPRLRNTAVDADAADLPVLNEISAQEKKGLIFAVLSMVICAALLIISTLPDDSAWRSTA